MKEYNEPTEEIPEPAEEVGEVDSLVQDVFGQKKYRFKLELEGELPDSLYKERNFNLGVKLTDSSGKPVRNGN